MTIVALTGTDTLRRLGELQDLLHDAVAHGALLGFAAPLDPIEAEVYWRQMAGEVARGERRLFVALDERGRVIGTAQLVPETRTDGRHRAEVQKVIVRRALRGRGIGAALMGRVEQEAQLTGRTLLYFDTSSGAGGAAVFYRKLGYRFVGSIPNYTADADGAMMPSAIFYKELPVRTVFTGAPFGRTAAG